jgi:hypothetical protein
MSDEEVLDIRQFTYKDNFDLELQRHGWHGFTYKQIYNDSEVIKLRWLSPPNTGKSYTYQEFYHRFGDNTFRKVLRTIFSGQRKYKELESSCSRLQLDNHLTFMREQEIAVLKGDFWTKNHRYKNVEGIGPTLQWYVAEWFRFSLKAPARHGVHIEGLAMGGDLDVVAFVGEKRVMVECKSGNPKNITEEQLHLFLQRAAYFKPEIALLLIDTESSIDQQIEMIKRVYANSDLVGPYSPKRVDWKPGSVHVRNVTKDIDKSLRAALFSHSSNSHEGRPLLDLSQTDIQKLKGILPQLDSVESSVMKLICEQAIQIGSKLIDAQTIFRHSAALGLIQDEVLESLEMLDERNYIKILGFMVRGNDFSFWVTTYGFDQYGRTFIPDYESLSDLLLTYVVRDDITDNKSLSRKMGIDQLTIDFILDVLKLKRSIKVTEGSGSPESSGITITIYDVSTEVKRKFRK